MDQSVAEETDLSPRGWLRAVGIALVSLVLAVVARRLILQELEGRIVWVTFYPAVVLAGIYGGWSSGLLTTAGACLVAVHGWRFFVPHPFIRDGGDWLGLWAFVFNCLLITLVAEMMRRARANALESKRQAELAKDQALAANRAKSVFLANMSHELRTPLNAILGFAQILGKDPFATTAQRDKLRTILGAGEHLLAIVNDILDLSKIESGKVHLEPKAFDLGELLQDLVEMLRIRAHAKGLELEVDQSSSFPRFVLADPSKLRQVLINLIGNAIKFTREGRVSVKLSLHGARSAAGERWLMFEVDDTGPGIAEADRERIFEPFVQLGAQEGTGLGLAITRQFVALMGGVISVRGELGKGTTFAFTVRYEPAEVSALEPGLRRQARVLSVEGASSLRVLVADDSADNRAVARGFLEPFGFPVREAENGHEAVRLFKAWKPHLVLLDRRMPVLDGIGAAREMRACEAATDRAAILAVTAHAYREEQDEMLEAGCDAFLAKPFSEGELLAAMERLLGLEMLCEDVVAEESPRLGVLEAELLDGVPAAELESLLGALERSDMGAIEAWIASVSRGRPELARHLGFHAERFEYGVLARWIRSFLEGGARCRM